MRYRPLAHFNVSVSAVSVALTDDDGARPIDDWVALIFRAIESGINCFEVQGRHPNIIEGLDRALEQVERRLMVISWRMGPRTIPEVLADKAFQPEVIHDCVQSVLARTRLGYLDILLLDDPGEHDLPPKSLVLLKDLKAKGQVRRIGVAGESQAIDAYISTGAFDILAIPYSMASGWRERLRMRAALEHEMAVIGYSYCPGHVHSAPVKAAKRSFWGGKPAPSKPGPYDFLGHVAHWSVDEICLAYALTEPGLASVQIIAHDLDAIVALAGSADRELPAGLAAQIEMARIDAAKEGETARRA